MQKKTKIIIGTAVVAAAAAVPTAAIAAGDADTPITGPALERATDAALEHLGQGRVTDTEEGDEDSYYEVEVTLDNGSEVDVQLDRDFNVVGSEADDPNEPETGNDD